MKFFNWFKKAPLEKQIFIRKVKNVSLPMSGALIEVDSSEEWQKIINTFVASQTFDIFITPNGRHHILLNDISFVYDGNDKKDNNYHG